MAKRKLTPEELERRRQRNAEIETLGREAREIFARVEERVESRRRAEAERLERRRRLLKRLLPFRRAA
jgi:hypothetical protein